MKFLDLFSGIGGFSLGLERAGHETVAFCEIDPFCRSVLAQHWPNVPCYEDIKLLTPERLAADGIAVDGICGGFPCQDISVAGKGAGIAGERSGLWSDYWRLIRGLRPQVVLVENVAALLGRGLDKVLGDLAAIGFDAEWHCIPASAVGAPHRRDRLWLMAYPARIQPGRQEQRAERKRTRESRQSIALANTNGQGLEGQWAFAGRIRTQLDNIGDNSWWLTEPNVGRVANGVPSRVDRLRSLGNAVVPQIPEIIGKVLDD